MYNFKETNIIPKNIMANNAIANNLFTEMFRPKNIQQAILTPRIANELSKGLVNSIILYGPAGTGKTTLSRIICSQYSDVLEINASLDRGIDTIRDTIISFCANRSLIDNEDGNSLKIIQLEEMDYLTPESFASLRNLIERFSNNVRFVCTCNYIEKVPEPIKSRMNLICISALNKEEEDYLINAYQERVKKILAYYKIGYTDETVAQFVKSNYPDMRSIMKKIQQLQVRGATEISNDMLAASFSASDLFQIITSAPNPWENYKSLVGYANNVESVMMEISEHFTEYLHTVAPQKDNKIPNCVITIAEHMNMLSNSIDKLIVLESLVFKLQYIINS